MKRLLNRFRLRKYKKGFTLIELIVVMAIIAVLVLLAAPKFIGQTNTAQDRNIQNDVKVAEMKVSEALIDGLDVWDSWTDDSVTSDTLKTFIHEDGTTLYGRGGPIYDRDIVEGGDYRILPRTFIEQEVRSRLEGTFYANDNGTVYYESGVVRQGESDKKEPEYSNEEIDDLVYNHGYIPIATADELNSIRNDTPRTYGKGTKWEKEYTGGLGKQYVQVANIDLSGYSEKEEGWTPIGTGSYRTGFKGTYDGGNYVIRKLEVKGSGKNLQGLFGRTDGATIRNVGLIDNKVTSTGAEYVGGLVGLAYDSIIEDSYATGSVTGRNRVGGLVGWAGTSTIKNSYVTGSVKGSYEGAGGLVGEVQYSNSIIENSYSTSSVTGAWRVGGLVGYAEYGTIENSYATGSVTGSGNNTGGLVGRADVSTEITNSYSEGSVTSTRDSVGGLVGSAYGTISNSYSTSSVTGAWTVGGLVGTTSGNISNSYATGSVTGSGNDAGGLVGSINGSATIENSYATGPVEGYRKVGGLVGWARLYPIISNSYATGSVTGTKSSVGGLVGEVSELGEADENTTISNSYATGLVTGPSSVGGLVGRVSWSQFPISNSYWDTESTGHTWSAGGVGKTTAEMKKKDTYTDGDSGWDFETVWKINEGEYPKLK